ncbi:MAG: tetratricopeptide repeat protein [Acidobacteria bacterium]|nr:tetratricopeptide repeat protein [Acidobacteriota bacterium]
MSREKEKPPVPAIVEVHAGRSGCSVDLDSGPPSKTGEAGVAILGAVEPGDHYLHISCPDVRKTSRFIVPSPGETLKVNSEDNLPGAEPGMGAAELRMKLHDHIQNAIRLRYRGRIDEAAEQLRDARRLDPENSDLHRELGITFLLGKDWKRARIEMLEAIHSDPTDAEAYNGLGYALEKLGLIDGAVEAFHIATKLDPSDTSYRRQYFGAIAKQAELRAEQTKR